MNLATAIKRGFTGSPVWNKARTHVLGMDASDVHYSLDREGSKDLVFAKFGGNG
jgi:hypothetical protein